MPSISHLPSSIPTTLPTMVPTNAPVFEVQAIFSYYMYMRNVTANEIFDKNDLDNVSFSTTSQDLNRGLRSLYEGFAKEQLYLTLGNGNRRLQNKESLVIVRQYDAFDATGKQASSLILYYIFIP